MLSGGRLQVRGIDGDPEWKIEERSLVVLIWTAKLIERKDSELRAAKNER